LWQYTDVSPYGGDLSWYNDTLANFNAEFSLGVPPPPADVTHTIPYPGVDYYTFVKNGVRVHLDLIDMVGKRAFVTDTNGGLQTVSNAAIQHNAQIAVNGDGWANVAPYLPNGFAASDGVVYSNVRNGEPFLNITQANELSMPWNDYSGAYNTTAGFRYLIENGVKKSYLDGTGIQYTELHARTAKGITKDGRLMIVVVDGQYPSSGLTLSQLADVLLYYGAQTAMDSDSGGSSTLWHTNKILNNPSDGSARAVVQHLLIFIPTAPPIGGTMKYKVVWANGVTKRTAPTTSATQVGERLLVNTVWDVLQDNIPDQTYPNDIYKKWVKFTDNTYGASIYGQGSVRMELVPEPPPPPPPAETVVSVALTAVVDGVNYVPASISGTTVTMKKG
jgi:hypothetical protein